MRVVAILSLSETELRYQWYTDNGKVRHAAALRWLQVGSVYVFKRDLFSYDLICLQLSTFDGVVVEVDEEDASWEQLMAALPQRLPGCKPWGDWFSEVAFPAFAANPQRVFERKQDVERIVVETHELLVRLGAGLRSPASAEDIGRVEQKLGITVPSTARALYERANGSDGEFGLWCWQIWPMDAEELTLGSYLKRPRNFAISPEGRAIDPTKYVRFMDCLIDAPLYAYCANPDSEYFGEVIGCHADNGTFDAFVSARSVTRFLELWVASGDNDVILVDEKAESVPGDPTNQ